MMEKAYKTYLENTHKCINTLWKIIDLQEENLPFTEENDQEIETLDCIMEQLISKCCSISFLEFQQEYTAFACSAQMMIPLLKKKLNEIESDLLLKEK